MHLSLFDLHADTACKMYERGEALFDNTLAVSLKRSQRYARYIQVMALWTPPEYDDEQGYSRLLKMVENLKNDTALSEGKATLHSVCPPKESTTPSLMLSLEDARILNGHIERVAEIAAMGVRSVIPLWSGESCIGGAHDTNTGLTDFGKRAAKEILTCDMLLDISHASEASSNDILNLSAACGKPVIASHSNAFPICPVSRNLRDWQTRAILSSGGIIGINLYRYFLEENGEATLDSILQHIEHFLSLGAENALSLGCDMDGADMPDAIPDLACLDRLADHLSAHGYSQKQIDALFFENAYRFAQKHLSSFCLS